MIHVKVEQGSPEWYAARCGVPTASSFEQIVTSKGEPSKQRVKYMNQLAGERVCGQVQEGFSSKAMERGKEVEAEAVAYYELICEIQTETVGICFKDKKKRIAASPDRLVGKDGLLELKCPLIHTHVAYMLEKKLPLEYFEQTQGQLFVTGRKWVDFLSYYPGLRPVLVRVERDEKFLEALESELEKFCTELDQKVELIK